MNDLLQHALRLAATRRIVVAALLLLFVWSAAAQGTEADDPAKLFERAQDAHQRGELPAAIELYNAALKAYPDFPEARFQLGTAFLALARTTEAEAAFRKAIELRPDWSLPQVSLGTMLVHKGEFTEAERLLSQALTAEPANQQALAAIIDLRLRTKAPAPVLNELLSRVREATAKASPTAATWAARAALEASFGARSEARRSIARSLEIDPSNRNALFLLADVALADGDTATAREALTRLDKGKATDALRLLRANVLAAEGNLDAALGEIDAMSAQTSASSELRKRLAAHTTNDRAALEKQLSADAKDVTILGRLCGLYRKDDPSRALIYCRRAAEAEPSNIRHAIGYGAALVQARQYEQAAALLKKIVEASPENATARANLAGALFQLKQYPEARVHLEWLTTAQPQTPGTWLLQGIVDDQLGAYPQALAAYQRFLSLADPAEHRLDIDKVNLRLPTVEKLAKQTKVRK